MCSRPWQKESTKSCKLTLKITIFLRFWGGTSHSDTPSPQAPKFCQFLIWAPPLLKNPGSAPVSRLWKLKKYILWISLKQNTLQRCKISYSSADVPPPPFFFFLNFWSQTFQLLLLFSTDNWQFTKNLCCFSFCLWPLTPRAWPLEILQISFIVYYNCINDMFVISQVTTTWCVVLFTHLPVLASWHAVMTTELASGITDLMQTDTSCDLSCDWCHDYHYGQ